MKILLALFTVLLLSASRGFAAESSDSKKPKAKPESSEKKTSAGKGSEGAQAKSGGCKKSKVFTVGSIAGWKIEGNEAVFFRGPFAICGHGAPDAQHPRESKALERTSSAGEPGAWTGIVTNTGQPDGKPIIQGSDDPAPGYYVSSTSLEDATKKKKDPDRYVNSKKIPYIVLCEVAMKKSGAKLGDFAVVYNTANQKYEFAIFADVGPDGKLGEGSIALGKALGLDGSARKGGTKKKNLIYLVFPGSGNEKPRPVEEIRSEGKKLFDAWGGLERIKACAKD